jgi:signal transduction histidine kinase
MKNANKKFLLKIYSASFLVLCVTMIFLYEMKINLIHDSIQNFILIKDLTSIKYILTPLFKGDLNHLTILENNKVILEMNDGPSVFKKIEYFRRFNISNNTIKIGFTPYYFYIGILIQLIFAYLLYIIYKLKNDRDLVLQKNYQLSQQLAHDIRSPISTLNLISSKISDPTIKSLQLAVVDQINSIANDLLKKTPQDKSKIDLQKSNTDQSNRHTNTLSPMLKNLEKEYQFKSKAISQKINFDIAYKQLESNFIAQKLSSVIYTCINNFIQNAIEATPRDGKINIIALKNKSGVIELKVVDNGKGIPESILKKLGNEILSHDKEHTHYSGNGIAVYNAKKDLAENGGNLSIISELNQGTEITISIYP